jgi:hypothetical protein
MGLIQEHIGGTNTIIVNIGIYKQIFLDYDIDQGMCMGINMWQVVVF